jgi:hypothetical protein
VSVGPHVVGRAGEEEQQRAPGFGVGAGVERQAADEVAMQEHGELRDRRVGLRHSRAVDQQALGLHLNRVGARLGHLGRRLLEA